jgi:Asp/Glu/hydantoin racemase
MAKRVAFINTVSSLPAVFKGLVTELAPQLDTYSIVDESLLQDTIRHGKLTKATIRRLVTYLELAQDTGADLVMVTCSSIGPAADIGSGMVEIPVLRVDEAMAIKALTYGANIGVAATLATTLLPTAALIERKAAESGKHVAIISKLCSGAFEALQSGDTAKHDALVKAGLEELIPRVDVIVLAQASMARIVETLPPGGRQVPILSSPRLAIEYLAQRMRDDPSSARAANAECQGG